jgi:hypothetical protein
VHPYLRADGRLAKLEVCLGGLEVVGGERRTTIVVGRGTVVEREKPTPAPESRVAVGTAAISVDAAAASAASQEWGMSSASSRNHLRWRSSAVEQLARATGARATGEQLATGELALGDMAIGELATETTWGETWGETH